MAIGERAIIKKYKKDGGEEQDRLSALPDSIIGIILSLLPLKNAVATAALSRQWRHRWTLVTSIHINSSDDFRYSACDFLTMIDKIIPKLTSRDLHCFNLSLLCSHVPTRGSRRCSSLQSLFSQICDRNVREIQVKSHNDHAVFQTCFSAPSCIFRTQSLVALELGSGFQYDAFPRCDDAYNLPKLKKLIISLQGENRGLLKRLHKDFPSLEELSLEIDFGKRNPSIVDISNKNLKRLYLNLLQPRTRLSEATTDVIVDAPELASFIIRTLHKIRLRFVTYPMSLLDVNAYDSNIPMAKIPTLQGLSGGDPYFWWLQ